MAIWAVVIAFTVAERGSALDRATSQLDYTVSMLVDLSVLAERAAETPAKPNDPDRAAAFWRVLLQYPTAWVWLETGAKITAGQEPPPNAGRLIIVAETNGDNTAHAALTESDALVDWRSAAWQRVITLVVVSVGFLILADRLSRAQSQRAAAEREAAAAQERIVQLGRYRAQLEATVAQRTAELSQTNLKLEKELTVRVAAEALLHRHDALLTAVTKSAAALLGATNVDGAAAPVLALIGEALAVGRVQVAETPIGSDGHVRLSIRHEWHAPGVPPLEDTKLLSDLDLSAVLPEVAIRLVAGEQVGVVQQDLEGPQRQLFAASGMRSALLVPVQIDSRLWGVVVFIDLEREKRVWTLAETDTLTTLAELIGSALLSERRTKELADADTIILNSPTILFRLQGEPSLPLIYISQNIIKFGYQPAALLASAAWQLLLIDPADQARVHVALTSVLQKDAAGATIEFRLQRGDGSRRWVEARYSPIRDKNGRLSEIEGIMIDVTERKAAEEKIALLARTDPLTGLANRRTFVERMQQAFIASRRGGSGFALLYLDLDHFKDINDTLGHATGDMLLQSVAARLAGSVRETDLAARLGGDEFAILQSDVADPASSATLAQKILSAMAAPFTLEGRIVSVSTSVGVATLEQDTPGPDTMLAQADLALYRAKEEGRNRYSFHSDDLDSIVRERITLDTDLREAIQHGGLEITYQPQVDLTSGAIIGMEALACWHHPTRGLVLPSVFIPAAEKTGAIFALGRWVLDQACEQMRHWIDLGIAPPVIAVKVSILQLKAPKEFLQEVKEALERWNLPAGRLEFDVTESMLAQLAWSRNDVLPVLRDRGVRIALANFGTEYSSFEYLRKYHVNYIKIAQSFTDMAMLDPEHAQTIRAIIHLARELNIGVIAEGVETAEQRSLLETVGLSKPAQSLCFSKPVNEAQAADLLRHDALLPAAIAPEALGVVKQTTALLVHPATSVQPRSTKAVLP